MITLEKEIEIVREAMENYEGATVEVFVDYEYADGSQYVERLIVPAAREWNFDETGHCFDRDYYLVPDLTRFPILKRYLESECELRLTRFA